MSAASRMQCRGRRGGARLQGTFSNRTITPFERPPTSRPEYSRRGSTVAEKRAPSILDERRHEGTRGDVERAYIVSGGIAARRSRRSAHRGRPPEGRVPPLTDERRTGRRRGQRPPSCSGSAGVAHRYLPDAAPSTLHHGGMPGMIIPTASNNNTHPRPWLRCLQVEMWAGRGIHTDGRKPSRLDSACWLFGRRWKLTLVFRPQLHDKVLTRRRREPAPVERSHCRDQ